MNFKKFTLATIITVLVLFVSSCTDRDHDEHYRVGAKIERLHETGSDFEGVIEGGFDLDLDHDLYDLNNRQITERVYDMNYIEGDVLFYVFLDGSPLEFLTFDLISGGQVVSSVSIYDIPRGETLVADEAVDDFFFDVHEVIRRDGYAKIRYRGLTTRIIQTELDIHPQIRTNVFLRR